MKLKFLGGCPNGCKIYICYIIELVSESPKGGKRAWNSPRVARGPGIPQGGPGMLNNLYWGPVLGFAGLGQSKHN